MPLALSAYIRSALVTVEHTLIPICLRMRGAGVSESLASYGVLHGMTLPMILYPMATLTSFAGLLVPEFAEAKAAGNDARMCRIAGRAVHTTLVYAVGVSVLMCLLSEEIGYCLYASYDAGYYIARIAPVIPVMYLDHITDSMLKGIGEHVYSMWVNISDACLSVLLVLLFIPRMGIGGYALVIVLMEAYNFLLSFIRLRRRIRFRVSLFRSLCLPGGAAALAAFLSHTLFAMHGAATYGLWLFFKTAIAASVFFGLVKLSELIPNKTNIRYCKTNK